MQSWGYISPKNKNTICKKVSSWTAVEVPKEQRRKFDSHQDLQLRSNLHTLKKSTSHFKSTPFIPSYQFWLEKIIYFEGVGPKKVFSSWRSRLTELFWVRTTKQLLWFYFRHETRYRKIGSPRGRIYPKTVLLLSFPLLLKGSLKLLSKWCSVLYTVVGEKEKSKKSDFILGTCQNTFLRKKFFSSLMNIWI